MSRIPTMHNARLLSTSRANGLTVSTVRLNFQSIAGRCRAMNLKTRNCIGKYRYERLPFTLILVYPFGLPDAALPAPRFGASDCRCDAHLFHFAEKPDVVGFRRLVGVAVRQWSVDEALD